MPRKVLRHLCCILGTCTAQIIGGQGDFRFEYVPDKLVMPAGTHVVHSHGLVVDDTNNIYLTYVPVPNSSDSNCLVRWDPAGRNGVVLEDGKDISSGTPHGLRLAKEGTETFLYHANNDQTLHKTRLDGSVIWTITGPPSPDPRFKSNKPTWFATPPGSDFVYMADGYGSNYIHVYTTNGTYTGNSFGGRGTSDGLFSTCHSINYDPRQKKLVVSDRENHRHQYFNFDSSSAAVFSHDSNFENKELQRPCNIRFDFGNGYAVVPALEGPVGILDENNQLVSLLDVAGLLGDKGHLHPHDATFLPNGDLVVCTWNPGRISYWRRLPKEETLQI
mmetsp:Transcript_37847/g.68399  ORF Transcript_37847/g.68399 Transcript_37847/m.68399 type:complete len:332 (+) Transcript_37847:52-1047(+)